MHQIASVAVRLCSLLGRHIRSDASARGGGEAGSGDEPATQAQAKAVGAKPAATFVVAVPQRRKRHRARRQAHLGGG